ncbi:probable serine/threonine-protein kinase nek3 [Bactrocera oleae]|uniref:probable serine/threonine-protein kinase nek3 n=1 Tax=Bactrocera oleae TaxID=104688 RepID=UPI00387E342D
MSNQSHVRLCRAVQQHPCIYDHAVANSVSREAYDRAWLKIAETCEETVDSCKQRWRDIRVTFSQSRVVSPKKRKGNRARENNLHDLLEFLIPHKNEEQPFCESDVEAEGITTPVDRNAQENAEVTPKTKADDGFLEEVVIKRGNEELKVKNKNEVGLKMREELNIEDDTVSKRPPSARLKVLRKNSEETKMAEGRPIRKTQSLGKLVNAEEIMKDIIDAGVSKKLPSSKSKVGTFYISPTNDESGTFFIKKTSVSNELEYAPDNEANVAAGEDVLSEFEHNEIEQPQSKVDETENNEQNDKPKDEFVKKRQCRLKRACKRGIGKKVTSQRDLRQKDSAIKSIKRGASRLKSLGEATNQLVAAANLSKKTGNTAPVDNQSTNFSAQKRTRTLCIPQADSHIVGPSQSPTTTLIKTLRDENSLSPAEKVVLHVTNASQASIDQGVQCSLQPTSSVDDFFDTIKPYLNEMNARQKLHFKKKIFESLMEVFDSPSDFPSNQETKAIIPKQLSAVSGGELNLVRELVAMVQAAKHTPELNLKLSDSSSELAPKTSPEKCALISPNASMRLTPSQPPPPLSLRVSPFNTTTTTNQMTNKPTPMLLTRAGETATSTQTTTTTPSSTVLQRRVIRKLVKVNEHGSSAYSMPTKSGACAPSNSEIVHRRIYRIYPKSNVTSASLENAVNASGVGTFIVPRSTTETTGNKDTISNKLVTKASSTLVANAANNQKLRQLMTPIRGSGGMSAATASSANATVKTDRNQQTIRVGARPLIRRYSVCGALPNDTASSNYLTTIANTKEPMSTTPKITIAHRSSPAHVVSREVFKLPTPFRSTISSVNATASTVSTTTTLRTSPVVSVRAGDRNSVVHAVPLNMGFNKFVRNDEKTPLPTSSSNTKVCRDSSSSSHVCTLSPFSTSSSPVVGNKRPLTTPAEYGKRNCSLTEQRKASEAVGEDMADMGIIAPDDFAVLNIKTEPADDD